MPKTILDVPNIGPCLNPRYQDTVVDIYEVDDSDGLAAAITTERCLVFSIDGQINSKHAKDNPFTELAFKQELLTDPENMQLYNTGKPMPAEEVIKEYVDSCELWTASNPFSQFVVVSKETDEFIGQAELVDFKSKDNTAEYSVVIDKKHWRKGFGTEITVAFSYNLASCLAQKSFKVNGEQDLKTIYATAHPSNGTAKIFPEVGYNHVNTFNHPEYGLREAFSLSIERVQEVIANTAKAKALRS